MSMLKYFNIIYVICDPFTFKTKILPLATQIQIGSRQVSLQQQIFLRYIISIYCVFHHITPH